MVGHADLQDFLATERVSDPYVSDSSVKWALVSEYQVHSHPGTRHPTL